MDPNQLRTLIQETLLSFDRRVKYSEDAVELLMMTAAHESRLGHYITQVGGPANGVFQMEPSTFIDIKGSYLAYRQLLDQETAKYFVTAWDPLEIQWNLKAAIIMARLHYYRVPSAIPSTRSGKASYCKEHWNTTAGAATPEDYYDAYYDLAGAAAGPYTGYKENKETK